MTGPARVTTRRESGETQAGRNDERPFAPSLRIRTLRARPERYNGAIEVGRTRHDPPISCGEAAGRDDKGPSPLVDHFAHADDTHEGLGVLRHHRGGPNASRPTIAVGLRRVVTAMHRVAVLRRADRTAGFRPPQIALQAELDRAGEHGVSDLVQRLVLDLRAFVHHRQGVKRGCNRPVR